jgi:hypothetical protein
MMSESDAQQQSEPTPPEPDITFLPDVVAVESVLRRYRDPRYRADGPNVIPVDQAVEITITTSDPFPERALGPVLFIGNTRATESERVGQNRYRFYVYEPEQLEDGAPIGVGWFGQRDPRQTGFRFSRDTDDRK